MRLRRRFTAQTTGLEAGRGLERSPRQRRISPASGTPKWRVSDVLFRGAPADAAGRKPRGTPCHSSAQVTHSKDSPVDAKTYPLQDILKPERRYIIPTFQ